MGSGSAIADREAMLAAQAQIEAAVAQMNSLSVDGFTAAELLDLQERRETVARLQPVLDHKVYARLRHETTPAALGATTFPKALAHRLRISETEARRRLDDAGVLGPRTALTGEALGPVYPNVAAAQADGAISGEHVKYIRWLFATLPTFVDHQTRESAEQALAGHARVLAPDAFRQVVKRLKYLLDQDGEYTEHDRARKRCVKLGRQGADGMVPISGYLTPEAAATWEPILAKYGAPGMCNSADDHPVVDGTPTDEQVRADTRTQGQRHHDALLAAGRAILASGALGRHQGLPATIIVTTTLAELEKGIGHGMTAGGVLVPMRDVIRLGSHSYHYLCIFDGTGVPLHLGRSKRTASAGQRIVLLAKDRGCSAPGCTASGYQCQVHHATADWKHGGRTDIDDLTLACGPHNRMIENTAWTTRKRPDGVTEWVPPPELDCGQARINTYHHPDRILAPDDDDDP